MAAPAEGLRGSEPPTQLPDKRLAVEFLSAEEVVERSLECQLFQGLCSEQFDEPVAEEAAVHAVGEGGEPRFEVGGAVWRDPLEPSGDVARDLDRAQRIGRQVGVAEDVDVAPTPVRTTGQTSPASSCAVPRPAASSNHFE